MKLEMSHNNSNMHLDAFGIGTRGRRKQTVKEIISTFQLLELKNKLLDSYFNLEVGDMPRLKHGFLFLFFLP
jgi:hypothetical protein